MRGVLVLVIVLGCSARDSVDCERCTQLRDHLVDLRLADVGSAEGVDMAQHRSAMQRALGESFLADCEHNMTIEQLRCAMKATDLHATMECSKPAPH